MRRNNKFGYINKNGEIIIDFCFDFASDFRDGLARIQFNKQWGYINKKGNILFTLKCNLCTDFSEEYARIEREDKWGYIDKTGKLILDCCYNNTDDFKNGIALVRESDKSEGVFINMQGDIILSGRNFLISEYSEGLINTVEKSKWGFIDINNHFVIGPKYKGAYPFSEGKAAVRMYKDKIGFINKTGEEIIPFEFTGGDPHFSEGLCSIMQNCKSDYGYIDDRGNIAIPFIYTFAGDFHEGIAVVKLKRKKKYGIINKLGECIIESKFQNICKFNGGLAEVIVGDEYESFMYGYINYFGDFVWEPSR